MDRTPDKKDDSLASPPSPASNTGNNVAEFTVSELSNAVKRALEDGFGHVRLRGEVSGYRGPHASGHCYFSLKDDKAKIDAVIWKGNWSRLKIKPEEGMEVIATGKISSFPGSSKYQIVIESLEPAGLGLGFRAAGHVHSFGAGDGRPSRCVKARNRPAGGQRAASSASSAARRATARRSGPRRAPRHGTRGSS